jgi:predicted NAD/FAD-dependent oxidoreductase
MEPWDIVIVGAGVCGLTLARLLEEDGRRVLLLDKGRLPGGRISSKTLEGSLLDTSTTSVTTDDQDVMNTLTRFAGARWTGARRGEPAVWEFPDPARHMMQSLAGTLPLQHTFVSHLSQEKTGYLGVVRHGFGEPVWARNVVLTMPVPQAQAIIAHSDLVLDYALDDVRYSKRQVLLAVFEGEHHSPDSAWSTDMIEKVRWRPRLDGMLGFEAFASPGWSEATWNQDATISQGRLLLEMSQLLDNARVWGSEVQRWRYATPLTPHPADYWAHPDIRGLFVAGDGFGQSAPLEWGVTRAVSSALALARTLRETIRG